MHCSFLVKRELSSDQRLLWLLVKIELDDPLENVGVKLVRQAGARTNDLAGDGCTTSIVLARGLIAEGVKVWFPALSHNICQVLTMFLV